MLEFSDAGDETAPAGSPSLSLAQTIEFLREQAELLAKNSKELDAGERRCCQFFLDRRLAGNRRRTVARRFGRPVAATSRYRTATENIGRVRRDIAAVC